MSFVQRFHCNIYVYVMSGPSLLIESIDSMIVHVYVQENSTQHWYIHTHNNIDYMYNPKMLRIIMKRSEQTKSSEDTSSPAKHTHLGIVHPHKLASKLHTKLM